MVVIWVKFEEKKVGRKRKRTASGWGGKITIIGNKANIKQPIERGEKQYLKKESHWRRVG